MIIRDIVVQSLSRVQLCNPTESSMPGSSVPHYLLELAQTHVHWVGDDIQPSRPLLPLSPSALQSFSAPGFFPWVHPTVSLNWVSNLLRYFYLFPTSVRPKLKPGLAIQRVIKEKSSAQQIPSARVKVKWVKSLSRVWLFATPWTVVCQAPLSMGFSRQEYWSGDLPDPGIELTSLACISCLGR